MIALTESLEYFAWNRKIADAFFRPELKSRPVRLAVDEETLSQIGGERDDLAIAVLEAAEARKSSTVQGLGLELFGRWKQDVSNCDSVPTPPFIAVLALYVLAVNHRGGEWKPHAYYHRLHDLLGRPAIRIKSLAQSWPLWVALERWSTRYKAGSLGVFRAESFGKQKHVGVPRRQILLAPREHDALSKEFLRAGLTPDSDPSDRRLHDVAKAAKLLSRTRRLLARWPTDEAAPALLQEIRSQLQAWDLRALEEKGTVVRVKLPLRLSLEARGRSFVAARFVTDLVTGMTDSDRHLVSTIRSRTSTVAREYELAAGDGVSGKPVVLDDRGDPSWAEAASWFEALRFQVRGSKTVLWRSKAEHRVLRPSDRRGLFEEVDVRDLSQGGDYLLLTESRHRYVLPKYVGEFLSDWAECDIASGVLYRRFRAMERSGSADLAPRIRLVGGIPSAAGRRSFLYFGLPGLSITVPSAMAAEPEVEIRAVNDDSREVGTVAARSETLAHASAEGGLWDDSEHEIHRFVIDEVPESCTRCEIRASVGAASAFVAFYVDLEPVTDEFAEPLPRDGLGLASRRAEAIFQGLSVNRMTSLPTAPLPPASRPIKCDIAKQVDRTAQRVMELIRTRHRLAWSEAKRLLPGCLPQDGSRAVSPRYLVHEVQTLHALGVVELEQDANGAIVSLAELPPQIALLPRLANRAYELRLAPWLAHQGVLVGCWLPRQLSALKRAAKKHAVDLHVGLRPERPLFAPHSRVLLTTGDNAIDRFSQLAKRIGVGFTGEVPLASQIVAGLKNIESLLESQGWTDGKPAATFIVRFFDPRTLGVVVEPPTSGDRYVLWECRYPDRPVWRFFLVDTEGNKRLEVPDRQVARWFVRRRAMPDAPIPGMEHDVFVPIELRFPPILERALVLSSGRTAVLRRYRQGSPFKVAGVSEHFGIPAPPEESVDWMSFRGRCTGNFCMYSGAYGTQAWPKGARLPMLGVHVKAVSQAGLEG